MQLTLLQADGFRAAGSSAGTVRLLVVVGLLIVVTLAFGLLVLRLRKRLFADDAGDDSQPLLLKDLRAMARRGQITEQEYETMRRRMVEKLSGRSVPPPSSRDEHRAPPGFDLTGEPLPRPEHGE